MWGYYVRGTREQFSFNRVTVQNTLPTQKGRKTKKKKKRRLAQIEKLKLSTRTAAGFVETSFGVAFLDLTMIG